MSEGKQAKVVMQLFVFFENPFWVGIFEREHDGQLSVCKVTFGSEPKDYEIREFIVKNCCKLRFSPSVTLEKAVKEHLNPKRLQREIKQQISHVGIGTKSQQALKVQQEQRKVERQTYSRKRREEEKELQFKLKQQKRKDKHKGR